MRNENCRERRNTERRKKSQRERETEMAQDIERARWRNIRISLSTTNNVT